MRDNHPTLLEIMKKLRLKDNLVTLLKRKGWTQSQLAREAKVSRSSLSDWSAGRSPRSLEQLKACCDVLGVTVDEILFTDIAAEVSVSATEKKILKDLLGETVLEGTYHLTVRKVRL